MLLSTLLFPERFAPRAAAAAREESMALPPSGANDVPVGAGAPSASTTGVSAARAAADPARIATVVREHQPFVWRCLRRLGVSEAHADDATQQVFLAFLGRMADVDTGRERSFLFGTAVRVASNVRRSAARERAVPWGDDVPDVPCEGPSPFDALHHAERLALLDQVLESLPEDFRTVFVLAELERMTAEEIAGCVAVPVGTVNSRLRRARELFAKQAERLRARLQTRSPS